MRGLLTGVAIIGAGIGTLVGLVMIVAGLIIFPPVILIPVGYFFYIRRQIRKNRRPGRGVVVPATYYSPPPMQSALADPTWID